MSTFTVLGTLHDQQFGRSIVSGSTEADNHKDVVME